MANKAHLRRQMAMAHLKGMKGLPQDASDIALQLHKEFNGLDRFDADIPRPETVVDVTQPTEKEIKDREGKVDRNQFGTIELPADSPRKLLDINLTIDQIQLSSIQQVIELEFKHFKPE